MQSKTSIPPDLHMAVHASVLEFMSRMNEAAEQGQEKIEETVNEFGYVLCKTIMEYHRIGRERMHQNLFTNMN